MIKFKCPQCSYHTINEIKIHAVVSTPVFNFIDYTSEIEYDGIPLIEKGEVSGYQCVNCNFVIKDENKIIDNPIDLYEWLAKMGMIK